MRSGAEVSSAAAEVGRIDIGTIRAEFPSLEVTDNGRRRYYFDNPAGTQVPKSVAERMSDCLLYRSANTGGFFKTSELAAEVTDNARRAMADFLNAPSPQEIIFGQNMTTLTFHLARSIGRFFNAGDELIVTRMEHDSNVEPWRLMARDFGLEIRYLPFDTETFEFDLDDLDALLSDKTRLVCIGGASNLTTLSRSPIKHGPSVHGRLLMLFNRRHTLPVMCRISVVTSSHALRTNSSVPIRVYCGEDGTYLNS